ncbi:hypothetical protein BS47DRAFT_1360946 [Hydnum rufescens UP504]|uniref:Uncharacterized protein n=1 Tax=Hydnum rufescens UP504 TaxID=1448309 RepID=A0A9P6DY22_9AGAM|nr:hypothetical protein BS47DRAFT_1360946 [Hydnum rufescens UP504]
MLAIDVCCACSASTWALLEYRQLPALNFATTQPHPATERRPHNHDTTATATAATAATAAALAHNHDHMTTHLLRRVHGHKTKTKTNDRPPNEWPQEPHPLQQVWSYLSENTRGGHANHTPAVAGITTNEDPWSEPPPPEIKLPQNKTRYRLNHPPNEPPLWEMTTQHPKEHPQTKPGTENARRGAPGTPDEPHPLKRMVKQNDNPPNEPTQLPPGNDDATHQNNTCQTKHANDDWPDQTQESTTHLLRRVCGNFKPWTNPTPTSAGILLNLHPPTEATTPPSENTRPWVRGNPNGEARNNVPSTTHPPKQYHTPARVEYHTPEWNKTWDS